MRPRNIWLFGAWLILGNMSSSFFFHVVANAEIYSSCLNNIQHCTYVIFFYPCFHSWKPRLIPYVVNYELCTYFITLRYLPSRRFLNHFKILFFRDGAQLLKCLLSKCKELNWTLNQCKESYVWRYVPAPPALGEVEIGRLRELIGHPETPRVWTLGFMSDLGSKTKGGEQSWTNVQCRPWTSTHMNLLHIYTQMQPITELVSRISKCRLTFKFKYTEKAP